MTTDQTRRQTVEYFVQCQQPDGSWEQASSTTPDPHFATERLAAKCRMLPDFVYRIARRTTAVVVEPYDPATTSPVPPPADRAAAYRLAADAVRDTIAPAGWPSDAIAIWNTVTNIAEQELRRVAAEEQPAVGEQPETPQTILPCNWARTRTEHTPHGWEPQPGMDPVHCPGYSKAPK